MTEDSPRTQLFDVRGFLEQTLKESDAAGAEQRHGIKARMLPLIHEDEDLRRLDLEALDHRDKLAELRKQTELVVRRLLAAEEGEVGVVRDAPKPRMKRVPMESKPKKLFLQKAVFKKSLPLI